MTTPENTVILQPPYDRLVPELRLAEYADLDDAAALAHLQAKTTAVVWGVSWGVLSPWAAANGVRAHLEDHAANASSPVRSVCLTILDNLRGNLNDQLDLTNPLTTMTGGMLDGLVSAGVMTTAQKAEVIALGTLAQPLPFATSVQPGHVMSARALIAQGA